jgi:hypothetical protein
MLFSDKSAVYCLGVHEQSRVDNSSAVQIENICPNWFKTDSLSEGG